MQRRREDVHRSRSGVKQNRLSSSAFVKDMRMTEVTARTSPNAGVNHASPATPRRSGSLLCGCSASDRSCTSTVRVQPNPNGVVPLTTSSVSLTRRIPTLPVASPNASREVPATSDSTPWGKVNEEVAYTFACPHGATAPMQHDLPSAVTLKSS